MQNMFINGILGIPGCGMELPGTVKQLVGDTLIHTGIGETCIGALRITKTQVVQ